MLVAEFRIGAIWFAVDVLDIQEVSKTLTYFRVPKAPDFIRGFVNLRGQVCTVVELGRFLKIEGHSSEPMNVITTSSQGMLAYEVDEIGDVIDVPSEYLQQTPENIPNSVKRFVSQNFINQDKYISLLNIKSISQNILNND